MRRIVACVLLVVALAACGGTADDDTVADEPSEPTTTTVDPDTPVSSPPQDPGAPPDPSSPERVEPQGGDSDLPTSFVPAEAEAVDGGVLVRFYGGVCDYLDRYEVTETADTVTVSLYYDNLETLQACIEIAVSREVLVPLDAPLGDRTLVDGNARHDED